LSQPGKRESRLFREARMLRRIEIHEVHVCPTVEEEDGELVYRVTGC